MPAGNSLPIPHSEALLSAKELAAHLHRDARTIRKLARLGIIPTLSYQNGGKRYYWFRISEVESALKGHP